MVNKITDEFFDMMFFLHKNVFNPNEISRKLPIPMSHFRVLSFLCKNKATIISDIAEELQISRPNMTPILDYLIEEDMVSKYPNPKDKRYFFIEITEKGKETLEVKSRLMKEELHSYLAKLDSQDLKVLEESIDNILKILKK